jgi:hypothetical protein
VLSNWLSKEDPKFSYWIEKLLLEEYKGNDQNLILALTQKINARSDGSASHRYILDLSMATDLLVSHVPSQLEPVFVQLKGIPMFRDEQRNPDFINKQQQWNSTLSCWCIKRALLVAHNSEVNRPDNLLMLTDAILKESSDRPYYKFWLPFCTLTFSISLGRIHNPHLFPQNHGQYFWSSISH